MKNLKKKKKLVKSHAQYEEARRASCCNLEDKNNISLQEKTSKTPLYCLLNKSMTFDPNKLTSGSQM